MLVSILYVIMEATVLDSLFQNLLQPPALCIYNIIMIYNHRQWYKLVIHEIKDNNSISLYSLIASCCYSFSHRGKNDHKCDALISLNMNHISVITRKVWFKVSILPFYSTHINILLILSSCDLLRTFWQCSWWNRSLSFWMAWKRWNEQFLSSSSSSLPSHRHRHTLATHNKALLISRLHITTTT